VRRRVALAGALLLLAGACTSSASSSGTSTTAPAPAGTSAASPSAGGQSPSDASPSAEEPAGATAQALIEQTCADNSREVLLRTWRGIMPGRSGNLQIISRFPDYIGAGLTHSSPYDYTQEVPFFLYGPGYVKPGVYEQPVTLADLAPTTGALVDFRFDAPDGTVQTQALEPDRPLPRLVVTMVWDSGGMDVLSTWPKDWPYLKSIMRDGAWFSHASVGASPSNTPTGHATIGTGAFPADNGMVDEYVKVNNRIEKPNANGPAFMIAPSLADLYDRAMDNEPVVGALASLSAHIMMIGHGSQWSGGDKDIAVTREKEDASTGGDDSAVQWNLTSGMAPFYELPRYVNQLPKIDQYNDELDAMDGARDGKWRDNSIEQFNKGFDTPARTPFQTQLFEKVIQEEGFGADEVPDLLYLNYKAIDVIGHAFSANGIEMSDALTVQDQHLKIMIDFLNRTVGTGKWVLALTADHGTNLDPEVSGAFQIDTGSIEELLNQEFDDGDDVPLIEKFRTTEFWLNEDELAQGGHDLLDVSNFLLGLTESQTFKPGGEPAPGHEDDPVFAGAFPTSLMDRLPCLPQARATS
jgi:predicted AlkP superfamily pyrophosphatase or phosphodiesterase